MIVRYRYRDFVTDDIRNITHNNSLDIDYDYVTGEFLPFQAFFTGRTMFKGVTIEPSIKFPDEQERFSDDAFFPCVEEYLNDVGFDASMPFMGAVSGGVDSSVLALHMMPKTIYSGYYEVDGYSEIEYSSSIAKEIGAEHIKYKLTEHDFLDNAVEYIHLTGTPAAGMGGVMEYVILKKAVKDTDINQVVFGNGGDEVFLGYFFNYYVKEFLENGDAEPAYMPNFLLSKKRIANELIDFMIVASLNRGGAGSLHSAFSLELVRKISRISPFLHKLLHININVTMPTLLHINNQICKAVGVCGINPLANRHLIKKAVSINTPMSTLPKERLRMACGNMPDGIKNNYTKKGFPMPVDRWPLLRDVLEDAYNSFSKRPQFSNVKPFNGVDRFAWSVFQAETILREVLK